MSYGHTGPLCEINCIVTRITQQQNGTSNDVECVVTFKTEQAPASEFNVIVSVGLSKYFEVGLRFYVPFIDKNSRAQFREVA